MNAPEFGTTGNPQPAGNCTQCGMRRYIGVTHSCSTGGPGTTLVHNPMLARKIDALTEELRVAKEAIAGAQKAMCEFKHIYPDGFPAGWDAQPEHLISQVVSLCNRQRCTFADLLDVIKQNADLNAKLAASSSALHGMLELFGNYGFADESPCERDREIIRIAEAAVNGILCEPTDLSKLQSQLAESEARVELVANG